MASEVKIKITADGAAAIPVIAGAAGALDDVETAADKAGNELRDVDAELGQLAKSVTASRVELKRLAHEFANVSDEAQKIDIEKAMRKVQKDISQATRAQKALKFSDLLPDTPDAGDVGRFAGSLGKTLAAAGANVGPVLGTSVGVAAAPFVASVMAAGIIGGVGLGGVAGGLAFAAKDQRVREAAKGVSTSVAQEMKSGAAAFVGPAIQGIGIIKKSIDTVDFDQIFRDSAKNVVPLAQGVGRMIEGLGDGIEDLSAVAGPVVAQIADGLGDIGEAAGEGMSSLADNADQAAASLGTLMDTAALATSAVFGIINGAMEVKGFFDEFAGGIFAFDSGLKILNKTFGTTDDEMDKNAAGHEKIKGALEGSRLATENFSEENQKSAISVQAHKKALDDLKNALLAEADPVFALMEAQQGLTSAQKAATEATKKFGANSPEAEAALRDLAMAALKLDVAGKELGGTFDGTMSPAMRRTLQAAGVTAPQIDRLERQFNEARAAGERFNRRYIATLRVDGYPTVYRQLFNVQDRLRDIPRAVNIAMRITGVGNVSAAAAAIRKNQAHGGITGAASGGMHDGMVWTGEYGPELLDLPPGTQVHSNADSMRMASQAAGGGGPVQVRFTPTGQRVLDELAEWLIERLAFTTRTQYGGSVDNMLSAVG